jgi:hypothetical protein
MLLLADSGGIPGLPRGGVKALKANCVAAFGPAQAGGRYSFRGRGSVEYELYTLELLERTHQEDVENVSTLPYHFARGLLDEENGELVNWSFFVHRRRSRRRRTNFDSGIVLPKYKDLKCPCPFRHPRVLVGSRTSATVEIDAPLVSTI